MKTRTEDLLVDIDRQRKDINQKIASSSIEYNTIIIRVAAVFLIMFLVQTFISIFRYTTRLGAYYQARADALYLLDETDISITDFQKMTAIFSPEGYDFGKIVRSPTDQAVDLAKEIIRRGRK